MEWITDNWIWLLLGGGMVGMHLFGHGRHKGQGGAHGGGGMGCCGGSGGRKATAHDGGEGESGHAMEGEERGDRVSGKALTSDRR